MGVLVGLAFLVLAAGFNLLDVYRNLFYSVDQFDHVSYNVARIVCVLFLLEIQFALGQAPLWLLRRRGAPLVLAPEEEIAICVVCGSAIMRAIMLALGFAGLYYWWMIGAGGAVAAAFGWGRFAQLWRAFAGARSGELRAANRFERIATAGALVALLWSVSVVFAEKLLLPNGPNGTGDFYTHYFPYMQHAVAAHNIWPNEVWYHFFVSKALSEGFFAILATDALGVQIASGAMFLAALLIVYCFVRRASGDPFVALAAAAVTAIGFIWNADPLYGFWADFPKEHVITATLWFGCMWAAWRGRSVEPADRAAWSMLASIAFCGLIVVRVQFAAIVAIFLLVMIAWDVLSRRGALARADAVQLAGVAVATAFVLGVNYAVMGVAEVTPFRLFWTFADQQRFAHWVSPFLMLLLQLGSSPDFGAIAIPNAQSLSALTLFSTMARLDRALPFMGPWGITFVVALGLTGYGLLTRSEVRSRALFSAAAALFLMLATSAVALVLSNQYASMFRLYMFCMFPVIALAALPFAGARAALGRRVAGGFAVVVSIQLLVAIPGELARVANPTLVTGFALGQLSIADVMSREGALWPQGLSMSRAVGPGTPIWSSDVGGGYCAAPECNLETFFSFSMGPEWATIMFGPPGAAEAALQRDHLNYFAFDTSVAFFDILPYAPLFAPAEIKRRFGLVWSSRGTYLLTWRSAATAPIPDEFYHGFAESTRGAELGIADFKGMYDILDGVYRSWKRNGEAWPIHLDPRVPLPRGWQ